jgi:hypothetical protein
VIISRCRVFLDGGPAPTDSQAEYAGSIPVIGSHRSAVQQMRRPEMRRPVDALGYSMDTGIFVCRSDPVYQLDGNSDHQAVRLSIGQHLLDGGDQFVTD